MAKSGFGVLNEEEKEVITQPTRNIIITPTRKSKTKKLDKNELLKLMKEKGKESIDPDHEELIKYIFPKNDLNPQENRNKNYTRRRIKTAVDLILAYCDVYSK